MNKQKKQKFTFCIEFQDQWFHRNSTIRKKNRIELITLLGIEAPAVNEIIKNGRYDAHKYEKILKQKFIKPIVEFENNEQ